MIEKQTIPITTAADGSATAYSNALNGRVVSVRYEKVDFADGVDFTITNETTGQGIWSQSNVNAADQVYPRQLLDDLVGGALTGVYQPVYLADERVKVIVAQGGNAKTGNITIYVER